MVQLTIDFDRSERDAAREEARQQANRLEVESHLVASGIRSRIAAEIVIAGVNGAKLVNQDGVRRLVVRLSERALQRQIGASKSGVHEAFERLQSLGLVTRGIGCYAVEWDAVCELEPLDPLAGLPPARSVGGRSVVGPLDPSKDQESIHPSIQSNPRPECIPSQQKPTIDRPAADRPTDQRPTEGLASGIGLQVRWRHLFTSEGKINRDGVVAVWRRAVAIGWLQGDPWETFAHLLGLIFWLPTRERKAAGVEHPISWLVAALDPRRREKLISWPPELYFARGREQVEIHRDWLEGRLAATEPEINRRYAKCPT